MVEEGACEVMNTTAMVWPQGRASSPGKPGSKAPPL